MCHPLSNSSTFRITIKNLIEFILKQKGYEQLVVARIMNAPKL
jgi:hypothetical protein